MILPFLYWQADHLNQISCLSVENYEIDNKKWVCIDSCNFLYWQTEHVKKSFLFCSGKLLDYTPHHTVPQGRESEGGHRIWSVLPIEVPILDNSVIVTFMYVCMFLLAACAISWISDFWCISVLGSDSDFLWNSNFCWNSVFWWNSVFLWNSEFWCNSDFFYDSDFFTIRIFVGIRIFDEIRIFGWNSIFSRFGFFHDSEFFYVIRIFYVFPFLRIHISDVIYWQFRFSNFCILFIYLCESNCLVNQSLLTLSNWRHFV